MIRACVAAPVRQDDELGWIYDVPLGARIQSETRMVDGIVVVLIDCDQRYLDALPEGSVLWAE